MPRDARFRQDTRTLHSPDARPSAARLSLGLAAGEPVRLQPVSIADGLGAPFAGAWTIDLARRYVDQIVLIDEATSPPAFVSPSSA
jgi:threonine dehydratase